VLRCAGKSLHGGCPFPEDTSGRPLSFVEWKALVCQDFGWTPSALGRQIFREVLELWLALDKIEKQRQIVERKWQLILSQLSQTPLSKEGARAQQRLFSQVWNMLEPKPKERGRKEFEELFGFSFVRGKKNADSGN